MALFECTECLNEIRVQVKDAEKQSMCRSCKSKTTNLKHGGRQTRLYAIWSAMKTRTGNKKSKAYKYYKDVTVCDTWLNDFGTFRTWAMGNGYDKDLTIDRIDNNGNYEPSNCRWVSQEIQSANTRAIRVNNTSGYRGVYKRTNKWRVKLTWKGVDHYIADGVSTPKEGAKLYNEYVKKNNLPHTLNTV